MFKEIELTNKIINLFKPRIYKVFGQNKMSTVCMTEQFDRLLPRHLNENKHNKFSFRRIEISN